MDLVEESSLNVKRREPAAYAAIAKTAVAPLIFLEPTSERALCSIHDQDDFDRSLFGANGGSVFLARFSSHSRAHK